MLVFIFCICWSPCVLINLNIGLLNQTIISSVLGLWLITFLDVFFHFLASELDSRVRLKSDAGPGICLLPSSWGKCILEEMVFLAGSHFTERKNNFSVELWTQNSPKASKTYLLLVAPREVSLREGSRLEKSGCALWVDYCPHTTKRLTSLRMQTGPGHH